MSETQENERVETVPPPRLDARVVLVTEVIHHGQAGEESPEDAAELDRLETAGGRQVSHLPLDEALSMADYLDAGFVPVSHTYEYLPGVGFMASVLLHRPGQD